MSNQINVELQAQLTADLIDFTKKRLAKGGSIHGLQASHTLFGEYMGDENSPGIDGFRDFFKHVPEKKKSVRTQFVPFSQLVDMIKTDYKEGEGIDNSKWQVPVSAFTTDQQLDVLANTITHYGIVAVPGGFRILSVLLFLMNLLIAKKLVGKLTPGHQKALPIAFLVAMFCFYEDLGLGGLNKATLDFYHNARQYARTGQHPEAEEGTDGYDDLKAEWKALLEGGIKAECLTDDVFDIFMFGLALGEMYTLSDCGKFSSEQHARLYTLTFDELDSETTFQLGMVCGFLRRAAQGRGLLVNESDEGFDEVDEESDTDAAGIYNKIDPDFLDADPNNDHLLLQIAREMLNAYNAFGSARSNAVSDLLDEDY